MSASDPDSKIDILDTADAVKKKLRKAYAAAGEIEGNGIISFVEYVLLPLSELRREDGKGHFVIERNEGEPLVYENITQLKEDYKADRLTPQLLKAGASAALVDLLAPIQAEFQASPEWQEIEKQAYPPAEPAKKQKKQKDKGSRYPGGVKAQPDGSVEGKDKQEVDVSNSAEEAMKNLAVNGEKS
jgi:tyrosyl-tRNA synthetase